MTSGKANTDAALSEGRPLILVVEDEAAPRMLTADHFQEAGYDVLETHSGAAAARLLEEHADIAAVVTDIRMPGELDGLSVAQLVRERSPYAPIVIVSGGGDPSSADLPARARYISKPYEGEDLVTLVNEMLGRRNQ